MEGFVQTDRFIRIVDSPLAEDVFLLEAFAGSEALSTPFSFRLDAQSLRGDIEPDEIVGKPITFTVRMAEGGDRYFNGYVQGLTGGQSIGGQRRRYTIDVVPWLWFLTQTSDCRIFQHKTAPKIIEQIFGDLGFTDFTMKDLKGNHPEREYCVQYRESDFAFVSRLMEEEGILYYFTHEDGKHTMVLADQPATHKACPEKAIKVNRGALTEDHISHWEHRWRFQAGKWAQTDYDFKDPPKNLMAKTDTLVTVPDVKKYEHYDYPGLYTKVKPDGQDLTKARMEMEEAGFDTVSAASTCRTLFAGGKFTVESHPTPQEEGGTWTITAIDHHASCPDRVSGAGGEQTYDNAFTCIPDTVVCRPPLKTPKPTVLGLQTAVVTGPSGEEIHPDEYGRVKVQFHWDREGGRDENSSCWMRVAHQVAGKGWGFHALPRMGQEVVVAFLEGDPDRPMVIGSVYNQDNMPPYGYPGNMTRSGYQSRSSKGGSAANFNEIRFEDKKGSEEVYVHAEKDMNRVVENNDTLKVGFDKADAGDQTIEIKNDRTETVGHDETITIGNDRTEDVGNNETITIGNDRTEHVKANEKITIDGNRTEKVVKDETITIDGARTETVAKDETITINGARTETVAKDETITINAARTETVAKDETITVNGARTEKVAKDESVSIGKNQTVQVADNRSFKVGKDDSLNVGKNLSVSAGDSITLKTGSASITMKSDGTITIQGKDITIKGSGKIVGKATQDMILKASKILQN